jgi:hypothetical protein
MEERRVGLDTQCVSYLVDAIDGVEEPTDSLAEERKALVRTLFYMPRTFYVTDTVVSECARIRNVDRRELHKSFFKVTLLNVSVRDKAAIRMRTKQLMAVHPELNDCRVLAEAEDAGLDTLRSYAVGPTGAPM